MPDERTQAPRPTYEARLGEERRAAASLARRQGLISNLRLSVFVVGLVAAWFSLGIRSMGAAWLVPVLVAFVTLVLLHDRVIRARERADRTVRYYEAGVARLDDPQSPAGCSRDGTEFMDGDHLHSADLDLFGPGSIYALLCRARSRPGAETLARWLSEPAAPDEVRERQAAVAELAGHIELREALALVGEGDDPPVSPDRLVAWCSGPPGPPVRGIRALAAILSALSSGALLGGAVAFGSGAIAFASPLLVAQSLFFGALAGRRRAVLAGIERAAPDLARLATLLELLESAQFESPRLRALRQTVEIDGLAPSRRIARLRRWIDLSEARRNQMYWVPPIGPILGLVTQATLAIEAWRNRVGPHVGEWVRAVGEFEALASLATHTFEHPEDVFPEVVDGPAVFEAEGIGHPLLPPDASVRNDVALGDAPRALVVSGSNMSGKSTLLRTVGSNAVLALAGAPVRARRLRLSPLTIGASIQVQDSLREGASRFYAEISRIARIVEATEADRPVLFILDEIFHGTNSHDRRIGAEAIIRALLERNAIGLVTTHDLALAKVADTLAPRVANVHFEDQMREGRIHFDYRMRPGVITRSNALALMRAVGLDVPDDS
ncbi:MAG: DNA mismatch repair protein MutS [Deltaproteobacteria bacterium]|nr:DNA mismatch repair protein MutS [Deltaproteobacteria bacterium]MBW2447528.1 DNA mismatch repair protein MutS [Deltaproteobacteria bacterium]